MVNIYQEESVRVSEEELEKLIAVIPEALLEAELKYSYFFGREGIDTSLLREGCLTKECIRKKIEYHKQLNIEVYNSNMDTLNQMLIGQTVEAKSTANHLFYDALFNDCISVIEAFGSDYELNLWKQVHQEYIEKYPNYAEIFQEDPLGWAISRTIKPIADVGATVVSSVFKGASEAILGTEWKKKLVLYGLLALGILIAVFLGYHFIKSYAITKGKKRAE